MNTLRLRLPATSANLGPGFDAVGLAMSFFLEVDASEAEASAGFRIEASGRDAELVGSLDRNLILQIYAGLCGGLRGSCTALRLRIHNEIPLGMGCGSSAAAILAGVLLANHFGRLGLTGQQVLEEACRREGHPDNVAPCFFGGLTVSAMDPPRDADACATEVHAATLPPCSGEVPPWRLLLALPGASLPTVQARALLPLHYTRAEAVENLQATALLVSAFALSRSDLLLRATRDRFHQPFRMAACPLLPRLLPLAGSTGIFSVTLSGAGPSVLLITDPEVSLKALVSTIREAAQEPELEVKEGRILHPREAPAMSLQGGDLRAGTKVT